MSVDTSFKTLPTNRVVSAFKTKEAVEAVTADLDQAGFSQDKLGIHHGEEGKDFIDPDGSRHGFLARLARLYQRLSGPEEWLLNQTQAALDAGHYLLSVQTDGSEEQYVKACNVMKPHTDYAIFFCGRTIIIVLESKSFSGAGRRSL